MNSRQNERVRSQAKFNIQADHMKGIERGTVICSIYKGTMSWRLYSPSLSISWSTPCNTRTIVQFRLEGRYKKSAETGRRRG